jgi:hypothetical protein
VIFKKRKDWVSKKSSMDIKEVVAVHLYWEDKSEPTMYLIRKAHLERFKEATLKLHHERGVNPHDGNKTARLYRMTASPLQSHGPYWWTTPNLQANGDSARATIIDTSLSTETLWLSDEEDLRGEAEEEAEAEAAAFPGNRE